MTKVGIIGAGMVGSAMLKFFKKANIPCVVYDKFVHPYTDADVHFEALQECDFIFLSVPTPTLDSGMQSILAMEDVLIRLEMIRFRGILVSKCTTLPGTHRSLANRFFDFPILHYPEFLRAAHAEDDFKNQKGILLSGHDFESILKLAEFLRDLFQHTPFKLYTSFASTEIAKYLHNCFIPVKLSLLNEFFDICDTYRVDFDSVIKGTQLLGRIGDSDLNVPGPDGLRGWSGFCFPKDTKALIHHMNGQGLSMDTLVGAVESNKKVRKV